MPSNEERGYVIRKLIRRAFWYGRSLGLKEPFLYKIVPVVAKVMKKPYPELTGQREDIRDLFDGTRAVQKELKAAVVSYQEWEPENDRQSKAIWRNLEIWKRRRQRKPFLDISKEFRITEENAKKNFYNIHSLITGRSYEPESYRRDYWIIRNPELKKSCATCPDRNSCTILCPDVLNFVEQDQAKQKEIFWEDLKSPSRK